MKTVVKQLIRELRQWGYSASLYKDALNVRRWDGVHVEFYACASADSKREFFTATYTIDGNATDLQFELPEQQDQFVEVIHRLLCDVPRVVTANKKDFSKVGIHLLNPTDLELERARESAEANGFRVVYVHTVKTWPRGGK